MIPFSGSVAPVLSPLKNLVTFCALPIPSAISLEVNFPCKGLTA